MSLEHLWAGWRAAYVSSTGTETGADGIADAPGEPAADDDRATAADGAVAGCVFCAIVASPLPDGERLVVWEGDEVVVIMNAYPYSTGHVMAMPRRHLRELDELTSSEERELWSSVKAAAAAVRRGFHPDGCNIGLNLGRAAGAGIPGHLHVHVVPRWIGDTNFMTSLAGTRVLPESLADSWQKVRSAWEEEVVAQ